MKIEYFVILVSLSLPIFGSAEHVTSQGHNSLPVSQQDICQQDCMIEKPESPQVLASLQEGLQGNDVRIVLPACLIRRGSYNVLPCELSRKRTREE